MIGVIIGAVFVAVVLFVLIGLVFTGAGAVLLIVVLWIGAAMLGGVVGIIKS